MSTTTKALLLTGLALLGVVAGLGAGILARIDGATIPAAVRAALIGFGSSLTLFLVGVTTYSLL
ncbi:hypothetical protein ACFWBG_34695 [Nocardia salmonicida]|uniref:hypothetical protein n=1 Tax=Nocardia salmonicida TaxID=53431 RepID=UPI00366D3AC8